MASIEDRVRDVEEGLRKVNETQTAQGTAITAQDKVHDIVLEKLSSIEKTVSKQTSFVAGIVATVSLIWIFADSVIEFFKD